MDHTYVGAWYMKIKYNNNMINAIIHSCVVGRVRDALQEWSWARRDSKQSQSVNQNAASTAWEPPPSSTMKCNIDASF